MPTIVHFYPSVRARVYERLTPFRSDHHVVLARHVQSDEVVGEGKEGGEVG